MSCGAAVEVSGLFNMPNATNITFTNVTSRGDCPQCGGDVRLIDGTFNMVSDVISIVRAPRWTVDTLEQLKEVLEGARRDLERGSAEGLRDVAEVSPESAGLILRALRDPATVSAIAIVSALITAIGVIVGYMTYQLTADAQRDIDQMIYGEVQRVFAEQGGHPGT